jgi:hypothetical protein
MVHESEFWAELSPEEQLIMKPAPPATEAVIRAWEADHAVSLPETLANALRTQDGGYVRGSGDELLIGAIATYLPLNSERWKHVDDEVDGALLADRAKQFVIGDYQGCAIVLDYNPGEHPRVLSIWHGMGAVLRNDEERTFDEFLQFVRDSQDNYDDEEFDEEEED